MKKWTSLLLALAMTISLAACGNSGTQENTSEPPASVSGSASQETVSQWVDSLGLDLGQAA